MKQDKYKTIVVFRIFKQGDVLALFPEHVERMNGDCSSYQRIGQHGGATYHHCIRITTPASPKEYASLKLELESLGYNLNIRKRR